ncbi:serine--tRNA ligase [Candidatus Uhrbacteria bacterium]|nr:serine--tRNA ligase [Candidatus Uhrbacteria bacterium]
MLDIHFVRDNTERVQQELDKRGMLFDLAAFMALDQKRRAAIARLDDHRAELNAASEGFSQLADEVKDGERKRLKELKAKIATGEYELKDIEEEWTRGLLQLPNMSHESVPVGPDSSGNVVVKKVGNAPVFSFAPLGHQDVPAIKQCIDLDRGAKISGSRFWYLKGPLARLALALMHYALDFYASKGFEPMMVPMLVKESAMIGTGFFPADKNEIYTVNPDEDNLFLVGTAEVALASYHMDECVDLSHGPIRYAGFSSCFRREAGTYGKDLHGIIRGHQFNKVEMFIFCRPEDSWREHEFLLQCSEEFLQSLGLHYQVLNMCTGDIGAPNAKKYDIETWMPGSQMYRETNSCSNDTDFQARRLHCTYRDAIGKQQHAHTLNNTGCADLRTMIALIETYQQEDGSVLIPPALQPYCGFDMISVQR